jgi:hypothetical protein
MPGGRARATPTAEAGYSTVWAARAVEINGKTSETTRREAALSKAGSIDRHPR